MEMFQNNRPVDGACSRPRAAAHEIYMTTAMLSDDSDVALPSPGQVSIATIACLGEGSHHGHHDRARALQFAGLGNRHETVHSYLRPGNQHKCT